MDKKAIKQKINDNAPSLLDMHRPTPKSEGGTYVDGNVVVVNPVEHMEEHGNLRIREKEEEVLKEKVDTREQLMKLEFKINNQILACERAMDFLEDGTIDFLKETQAPVAQRRRDIGKTIEDLIKELSDEDPLVKAAMGIRSIGKMTIAYCLSYIKLEEAEHASSLWSYVGLDKPSHKRYSKGESGGGNKKLRCALYRMADSQIKGRGPYREVYDRAKAVKQQSEELVWTRTTQGKLVEKPWKDVKAGHVHGHAIRVMIKHFLADYWLVGRTLRGLDTNPCYAEAVLKSGHRTIMPEERGWVY